MSISQHDGAQLPVVADGIKLRDWFAGMTMPALIASRIASSPTFAAEMAYVQADAMMKARKKTRNKTGEAES